MPRRTVEVVACDDGVVRKLGWGSGFTVVACIRWSLAEERPLGAALGLVRVDGLDATSIIAALVARLGSARSPVLLDSVTIAGFNVVSPPLLERLAGSPTLFVYKYRPSLERLRAGLEASGLPFKDLRLRVIKAVVGGVEEVDTAKGRLYLSPWGLSLGEAVGVVEAAQVRARVPEALRIAHYTASEASRTLLGG